MQTIDRSLMTFLLNAIWQAPLIAVAVAVACRWMRHAPARHIHLICVVGLFASLLLPAISTRRTAPETERLAVPQQELTTPAPATAPAPIAATPRTVQLPQTAVSFAIWAFAGFLLFRVVLLAVAARKTLRICRDSEPAPSCPAFDRARAAFSLDDVELRWSATVTGPVTAGRLIILPTAMVDASDDVLTTAIGHEMAHIARHDFAWNIAYEILSLPISFQPAAFWLRRQLDRTRELACDELVAIRLLDSRAYAQSIMEIASSMCAVSRPGYTLGVFDGDILEERIKRLVQRPAAYTRRARVLAVAGIAGLAICLVAASSLPPRSPSPRAPKAPPSRICAPAPLPTTPAISPPPSHPLNAPSPPSPTISRLASSSSTPTCSWTRRPPMKRPARRRSKPFAAIRRICLPPWRWFPSTVRPAQPNPTSCCSKPSSSIPNRRKPTTPSVSSTGRLPILASSR
jgi:beta-lactamase regulating signal transducer with metallopeptidase domain